MRKQFLRDIVALLTAIAAGLVMLVLVYALPTAPMREHLAAEIDSLESYWNGSPFFERPNTELDTCTDYHMLAIAVNEGTAGTFKEVLKAAYMAPKQEGYDQLDILKSTLHPSDDDMQIMYARYWHGYLVPLKLMLLFADYFSILLYNGIALLGLLLLVAYLMTRRGLQRYLPAFLLMIGIISPISIAMCMQYYAVTYIALVSTAIVLKCHEFLRENNRYRTLFMLVGAATSYFDFLTAPVVTLGMPLCILVLLWHRDKDVRISSLLQCVLFWGIGYACMWASKWCIGSLFLKSNVLKEAASQISLRVSSQEGHSMEPTADTLGWMDVIVACLRRAFGPISNKLLVLVFVCYAAVRLIWIKRDDGLLRHVDYKCVLCLLCIAALPLAWSIGLKNHTYMHAYFTFRMYAVTALSLGSLLLVRIGRQEAQTRATGAHFREMVADEARSN